MPRLLAALAVLLLSAPALAQTDYAVSGRVVDAETGGAIEVASVAVWRISARRTVEPYLETGAVTDASGGFRIGGLTRGRFYLEVSYVGYTTLRTDTLRITPESPVADLGEIALEVDEDALGDVTVTGERQRVEIRVDRTVYRISDDPLTAGGSTSEALETLPSIEVDVEGNVALRGNSNVVVLIDGRPAPVGRDFIGVYLQSLPADAVESVEVIPNPSAAYRADGSAGILNIVLKDNVELGIGGAITLGGDSEGGYRGTGLLTLGRGPLRLSATAALRESANTNDGARLRINRFLGDAATEIAQTSASDRARGSLLGSLSADWQVTPQTTVTASVNGTRRSGGSDESTDLVESALDGTRLDGLVRTTDDEGDGVSGSLRLGLRHDFEGVSEETGGEGRRGGRGGRGDRSGGRRGGRGGSRVNLGEHGIAVDLQLRTSTNDDTDVLLETGDGGTMLLDRLATTDGSSESLSGQVDYARPVGQTRVELGARADVEGQRSRLLAEVFDPSTGGYTVDDGLSNTYDLDEQMGAAYVQLAREIGPLAVQAGLRGEASTRSFVLSGETFDYDDAHVFPSASLAMTVGEATVLRGSYSRRIDRPRGRQLNPFPSTDDPLNIRIGNPDLRPEFTDALEVSAVRQTGWGMLTVTPFLRRTTDVIRRFQTVDAQGVTTSTYRNLDSATSSGLEVVVAYQAGGRLRGFASLEGFRRTTDGTSVESGLGSDAFGWSGRVNGTLDLGDRFGWGGLTLQSSAFYRAPQVTEQGRFSSRVFFDIGFRQRLFDGRGSLALRARDPFAWGGIDFEQDDERLYQTFSRSAFRNQVGLTFTYAFGQTEERPGRVGAGDGGGDAAEPVDF